MAQQATRCLTPKLREVVTLRYAAGLRAHRYDPRAPAAPSPGERRALRRDLTAHGGLRGRLVGLINIPPGGPKPL